MGFFYSLVWPEGTGAAQNLLNVIGKWGFFPYITKVSGPFRFAKGDGGKLGNVWNHNLWGLVNLWRGGNRQGFLWGNESIENLRLRAGDSR